MVSSHHSYPTQHISVSFSSHCPVLFCLLHKSHSQSLSVLLFTMVLPINPNFTRLHCPYLFLPLPLCTFPLETFKPNCFLLSLQSGSYWDKIAPRKSCEILALEPPLQGRTASQPYSHGQASSMPHLKPIQGREWDETYRHLLQTGPGLSQL